MHFLGRFRILTKVLAIVVLLSGIAATIAYVGVSALGQLSEKADVMSSAARRALLAARANQNVIALNRAEFRSALDPRDENRLAAREIIEAQIKQYQERFSQTVDDQAKAMLPAAREAFAAYQTELNATLAAIDAEKSSKLSESAEKLRERAMKSRAAAEALQDKIRVVADRLNARVEEKSKEARAEYESTARLMLILASLGIILGGTLGFLVGQYGVARPIRAIVALLQQLASGNYEIAIHSDDRADDGVLARRIVNAADLGAYLVEYADGLLWVETGQQFLIGGRERQGEREAALPECLEVIPEPPIDLGDLFLIDGGNPALP